MNYSDLSKAITAEDIIRRYNLENLKSDRRIIQKIASDLTNTNAQINDFVNAVTKNIDELQDQVDGNITTWFFNGVPSLENSPANEWIREEDKNNHLGDLYYDQDTGYAYRFTLQDEKYLWLEIKDTDVTKALAMANSAQDTADRKRNTFVSTPYPPYEVGDLWVKEDKELYRCRAKRTEGEFHDVDWIPATEYTNDDYAKNVEAVLDQFKEKVEKDYVTHTTLETTVDSITGEVDAKTTKIVEDAQKKYEYYDEQVSKLEIDTEGIKSTVSSVESELQTAKSNLDSLSGKVDGVSANFNDFKDNEYLKSIENLQDQIDGAIQFWNGSEIPTINNYPANEWTTENDRNNHRADIYTVIEDVEGELKQGKSYRFDKVGDTWQWIELTDNELSAVQALAQQAMDKSNTNAENINKLTIKTSELEQTDSEIKASVSELNNRYEQDITIDKKVEGYPIIVEDAGAYNVEELKVYGNSEQDSTKGYQLIDFNRTYNENNMEYSFKDDILTWKALSENTYNNIKWDITDLLKKNLGKTLTFGYSNFEYDGLGTPIQLNFTLNDDTYKYHGLVLYPIKINEYKIPNDLSNIKNIRLAFYTNNNKTAKISSLKITKPLLYFKEDNPDGIYEKYTGGIPSPNSDYPSDIRNIEPIENLYDAKIQAGTYNDAVYTISEDGLITQSSSDASGWTINQKRKFTLTAGTYTISIIGKNLNINLQLRNLDDNKDIFVTKNNITTFTLEKNTNLALKTHGSSNLYPQSYYIQIEKGTINHNYVPYGHWLKGKIIGQNFFDKSKLTLYQGTNNDGVITSPLASETSGIINTIIYMHNDMIFKAGETIYLSADIKLLDDAQGRFNTINDNGKHRATTILNPTLSASYQRYQTSITFSNDATMTSLLIQIAGATGRVEISNIMISSSKNPLYEPYKEKEFLYPMGKENLFDNEFKQGNLNGTNNSVRICNKNNLFLEDGIYTIVSNLPDTFNYAIYTNSNPFPSPVSSTYDSGWKIGSTNISFNGNNEYFGIIVEKRDRSNITPDDLKDFNFKLYKGDSLPYHELSKINETKDDLEFISGVLNKKIGRIVLTGDENWTLSDTKIGYRILKTTILNSNFIQSHTNLFCTHFKAEATYNNPAVGNMCISANYLIFNYDNGVIGVDAFKQWLKGQYNAGTPVTIYYELETPEQIQLNPINIELFEGYNRITLEDKYGIVEEAEMTYLTNSKLNGQYATKAELKLTSDSITSEVNKKVSTDNFNSTVSDLNSKIKQTADSIKSEVSATYSTKTEVEEAVSNIEIGGRNLLLGTATATGDVADGTGTLVDTNLFDGIKGIKTHTAWNERYMNLKNIADRKGFEVGDKLIASVYIKADQNVTGNLWLERATRTGNVAETTIKNAQITTEWKQYSFPFIADEGSLSRTNTRIEFDTATEDNYIYWAGWKLEKGTKSSDWTPAPEDTDSKIDTAKNDAISSANSSTDDKLKSYSTTTEMNNTITQKITDSENSITQNVNKQITDISGKVTDIEGKVELKIDEKDLFSKFNVNVGQVKITSDNFKLDEEGNIEFNKGTARDISISNGNINITDEGKDKLAHIELNSTGEYKSKLELNSYATSRVTTFGRNTYKTEDSAYDGIRQYIGDENSNWSTNSNLRAQGLFVHSSYSELKGTVSGVTPNSIYVSNVETDNATKMTPDYISITKTPTSPNHVVRLQDIVKSGQNGKCFATSGNLNNLTDTGFYHVNSPTNSPYEGDDTNGFVITMNYNDTYIAQIFIADSANSLFIRIKTSRGWNNWINH